MIGPVVDLVTGQEWMGGGPSGCLRCGRRRRRGKKYESHSEEIRNEPEEPQVEAPNEMRGPADREGRSRWLVWGGTTI